MHSSLNVEVDSCSPSFDIALEPRCVCRRGLGFAPLAVIMVTSVHERALEATLATLPAGALAIAGIGGGLACDAAKYLAWRSGLRFVCIPTALTVDAS